MSTAVKDAHRRSSGLIANLVGEARRRDPVLFWVSFGHLILLALLLAAAPFEGRTVLGINLWIKPIKFVIANTVFMLTIGWLSHHLPAGERARRRVSRLVALTITAETVLITLQAARGTTSHFNLSSWADAGVLSLMGLMIVLNTIVVAYVAWRFWRNEAAVSAPYLWGIRLGLLIFLLASLEGFVMIGLMSHGVGVADGGPGLPVVNWSTRGGDLRIAHFVGLHALQVLPLVGHLLSLPGAARRTRRPVYWVWAAGAAYGGLALLLFLQAMSGRPLLSLGV